MPAVLFLAALVLGIVFAAIFFFFFSDILTQRAPKIATDVLSGIVDFVSKTTQRCAAYDKQENCDGDSVCKWCKIVDENQNTILFCTTKKEADRLKCP